MIFDTFLGESELPVKITYSFTEGRKAKLHAPMPECYPAEASDAEVEEVNVFGIDILDILSPAIKELIEEQALDHSVNAAIDHAEIEADRIGDEQRELKHWDRSQGEQY